jgi:hypothetical protein
MPPQEIEQEKSTSDFHIQLSKSFKGLVEYKRDGEVVLSQKCRHDTSSQSHQTIFWRIDKDELNNGFNVAKENLLRLFLVDGDEKRRKLVVELQPPRFLSGLSERFAKIVDW